MAKSSKRGVDLDSLRDELRRVGLRATGPRVAVLRNLYAATGPVSHADLATELGPEGWDRATVYRNLIDLTEAGILKRVDHGDHTWRFTLKKNDVRTNGQAFFVCDVSGEITPLPENTVAVTPGRGVPRALKAGQYVVHVRGVSDKYFKK
jgi:Fur family ferric uptake transcriptional regulator